MVTAETGTQLEALDENCPVEEFDDTSRQVVCVTAALALTVIAPETVFGGTVCASVINVKEVLALAPSGIANNKNTRKKLTGVFWFIDVKHLTKRFRRQFVFF